MFLIYQLSCIFEFVIILLPMKPMFAERMDNVPKSFIREILKVAQDKDAISFAGGLPHPGLFPVKELELATSKVFESASTALQYSNSEGSAELRNHISRRYKEKLNLDIPISQILITTGSQQGLDLLGKIFINEHDSLIIEEPGYLGAIQAFSVYRPQFIPVILENDGIDTKALKKIFDTHNPRLMYTVPNFQNPSGISYSLEKRKEVAEILKYCQTYLIEDDPYGELRFEGNAKPSFKTLLPDKTILLGTFSKTVVPSFRIGWVVAPEEIMDKLIIAKQAADLHTNFFCQLIISQYFNLFNSQDHIKTICDCYGKQKNAMINAINKYFPSGINYTNPEGGMFLWVTLPEGYSTMNLLKISSKNKVFFVPGNQFYVNRTSDVNTFRLNFSGLNEKRIDEGIKLLAESIIELLK